jgi:hypothetical protein
MKSMRTIPVVVVAIVACIAMADEKHTESPRSSKAKASIAKHDVAVKQLREEFARKLAEADAQLVSDLDAAIKSVASSGDVAEIQRIANAKLAAQDTYERHKTDAQLDHPGAVRDVILSRKVWSYRVNNETPVLLTFNKNGAVAAGNKDFGRWGAVREGDVELLTMTGTSGTAKLALNFDGYFSGKLSDLSIVLQPPDVKQ